MYIHVIYPFFLFFFFFKFQEKLYSVRCINFLEGFSAKKSVWMIPFVNDKHK